MLLPPSVARSDLSGCDVTRKGGVVLRLPGRQTRNYSFRSQSFVASFLAVRFRQDVPETFIIKDQMSSGKAKQNPSGRALLAGSVSRHGCITLGGDRSWL